MALLGRKPRQSPGLGMDRLAAVAGDPYLTIDDGDPCSLVDLVVLEQLAGSLLKKIELDPSRPQMLTIRHGVGYILLLE